MHNNLEVENTLNEQYILEKLSPPLRVMLWAWSRLFLQISKDQDTQRSLQSLNETILENKAVVFFDHHFPFDAIPAALSISKSLTTTKEVLAPYASYLEMGVTNEGKKNLYFQLRSAFFTWVKNKISNDEDRITLLPVVRSFEYRNPQMREIVKQRFRQSNVEYVSSLNEFFLDGKDSGKVCFLAPMAGLAKHDRS